MKKIPWYYWIPILGAFVFMIEDFEQYNVITERWLVFQVGAVISLALIYLVFMIWFFAQGYPFK